MSEVKKLSYITYQSFPSEKANTIQTISNIKYFVKQNIKVKLYFPLREEQSSAELKNIQNYYSINEKFEIFGIKHNLPFGRFKFFNSFFFLISHYLWSKKTVKNVILNDELPDMFFTRSDWVFYFLSRKKLNVIFECHQYSKIRFFLLKRSLKSKNSRIIFLNENLYQDFKFKKLLKDNFSIIHNGVDLDYFMEKIEKNQKEVVFVGNLKRFGESRDIDFVISAVLKIKSGFRLKIIGATPEEIEEIKKKYSDAYFNDNITILGRLSRFETLKHMRSSEIGLLINSDSNTHSIKYTSPIKYFEYLGAGLKVLAVDFDAHRKLPFAENIKFFNHKDYSSFEEALLALNQLEFSNNDIRSEISLKSRISKILELSNF